MISRWGESMEKIKKYMNSAFEWLSRYIYPRLLAVLGIGLVTSILLFVYTINGLGDNGEYFRVLNSNSLYRVNGDSYDNVAYFVKDFSIMRYFNEKLFPLNNFSSPLPFGLINFFIVKHFSIFVS